MLEYSFLYTDLLTCILLYSFHCNLILVFQKQSLLQNLYTCILPQFPCGHPILVFLLHHLSSLTSIFCHRKNNNIYQTRSYKIPVPTENTTREKLLFLSSIPSILFSSSCFLMFFSSSALFELCSFCFLFFLLSCTSVSFLLDSGHNNSSSSESWLSIPASFSDATAILQISFLNPQSSLNSFNFLKTSAFYFMSICCFIFLTFDLQTASALAFVHALSASKGLQVVLVLAQGAHEVVWLYT